MKDLQEFIETLNKEEELIAKSIVLNKSLSGVFSRASGIMDSFFDSGNFKTLQSYFVGLDDILLQQLNLIGEYANMLGISEKRLEEIKNKIYTYETKL